jgi:4-hydroxyproline epimerase
MRRVAIIDSHTAGEPTRLVLDGGPDLGSGTIAERREIFRDRFDTFRSAVVNEPRGSEVTVGALLCTPRDPSCAAGVIFFNNISVLGMCGHGTIGLVATLAYLGRLAPGTQRIETPVGVVAARLHGDGRVTVRNVPSYRHGHRIELEVPGAGRVTGDVAWGGNWFFLTDDHCQTLLVENVDALTDVAWRIRAALEAGGVTGAGGAAIDHIELGGPGQDGADGRNFVLCPGNAYDRSPCGTGTSAKVACLAADGLLVPGETWIQESIIGTRFEACYTLVDGAVQPEITGSAYVTLEGSLLLDPRDPLCWGIGTST